MAILARSNPDHLHFGRAILWGGLIAGLLDATDGVIAFAFKGMNPIQVLQYIASGVLGKAAFNGGLLTAFAGLLFHFFISFVLAFLYTFAAGRFKVLQRQPIPFGLAFGAGVNLVMTYLVLPLTAVSPSAFELAYFLNGIIGHALFVGLPIAFATRKYLSESE